MDCTLIRADLNIADVSDAATMCQEMNSTKELCFLLDMHTAYFRRSLHFISRFMTILIRMVEQWKYFSAFNGVTASYLKTHHLSSDVNAYLPSETVLICRFFEDFPCKYKYCLSSRKTDSHQVTVNNAAFCHIFIRRKLELLLNSYEPKIALALVNPGRILLSTWLSRIRGLLMTKPYARSQLSTKNLV